MLSAVLAKWYNRERILKDSLDVSKPTGSLDLKVGGSIWKREEENVYNSGTWKS